MASFIGYNYIYVPQTNQVSKIHVQIANERSLQQLQSDVAGLFKQIERYRERLPKEPDSSWLAREVVALSQKAGVQLTTISQDEPEKLEQFTRLMVDVQFTASYHQLGTLLDNIERSDHFIRIDRVNVAHGRTEQEPVSIQLELSTFYLPPPGGMSVESAE